MHEAEDLIPHILQPLTDISQVRQILQTEQTDREEKEEDGPLHVPWL